MNSLYFLTTEPIINSKQFKEQHGRGGAVMESWNKKAFNT